MNSLDLQSISFSYSHSEKTIISSFTASFPRGWTGLIGPNGCGKSTLLKILGGKIKPEAGTISKLYRSYYCEQETLSPPLDLTLLKTAHDYEARKIKASLELNHLLDRNWDEMSCGEQKRFQLACALWNKPELLLIDEPTNHLDSLNRQYIIRALKEFSGIGVLVSHDRELLEALCIKSIFFVADHIFDISAPYSEARKQLDKNFSSWDHEKETLRKKSTQLKAEVQRLEKIQASSQNRLSKKKVDPKDRDAKGKINLAKLTGKDASLGQKKQNLQNRMDSLDTKVKSFAHIQDYSDDIFFDKTQKVSKRSLLYKEEGSLTLPSGLSLRFQELSMLSQEKIGIVGDNGVGKSSFLDSMLKLNWLKTDNFFYLRQELTESDKQALQKQLMSLNKENYARCLQIIARLGSDAQQIFKSTNWSSGESRKIAIALSIVNKIDLLILDEPTNHLDLDSIEKLEKALLASQLSLLIVSHDNDFIRKICHKIWKFSKLPDGNSIMHEEILS